MSTEHIPASLRETISKELVTIILGSRDTVIPVDIAKEIIYLWRQDQLANPEGLKVLTEASLLASREKTMGIFSTYGLNQLVIAL